MSPQAIATPLRTARIPSLRQRISETELLDAPGHDPGLLRDNLRDIRRVNTLVGGTAGIIRHLPALVDSIPLSKTITILDLATGSADIPLAISRWADQTGRSVEICASDVSSDILAIAREHTSADPAISLAQLDARDVPTPDRSFDVVLCSLALHHFSPNDAVMVLREMDRLATRGFILNDLRRSRAGYLATKVASLLMTRNPLTHHDAPLSIQRAYSPAELLWLLHHADVPDARLFTAPWFRMIAVRDKCS